MATFKELEEEIAMNEEILNKKRKKLRRKNKIVLFTGVALIAGAFAFYKVALSSNLDRETLNTIKNEASGMIVGTYAA